MNSHYMMYKIVKYLSNEMVDIMLTASSSESFCSYIACTSSAYRPSNRKTLIAVSETRASYPPIFQIHGKGLALTKTLSIAVNRSLH